MAINNPNTASVLLAAMQQIIYIGTAVPATSVYVREFNKMLAGSFPAINLTGGGWNRARESRSTYAGMQHLKAKYYNRFDQSNTPIEDLWTAAVGDVEIMAANLENNETLLIQAADHAISIGGMSFPDDDIPKKITTDAGMTLLEAELIVSYLILPYDVAAVFP